MFVKTYGKGVLDVLSGAATTATAYELMNFDNATRAEQAQHLFVAPNQGLDNESACTNCQVARQNQPRGMGRMAAPDSLL